MASFGNMDIRKMLLKKKINGSRVTRYVIFKAMKKQCGPYLCERDESLLWSLSNDDYRSVQEIDKRFETMWMDFERKFGADIKYGYQMALYEICNLGSDKKNIKKIENYLYRNNRMGIIGIFRRAIFHIFD